MIRIDSLTKAYGDFTALDSLSLTVKAGEIYCLLGANGAGKTTTINLLLGFIKPTSGTAYINDINVVEKPKLTKNHLAYIPENLMLYPSLTALENLDYFSGIANKKFKKHELEGFLIEAGLQKEAFQKSVAKYSKGMRQKVGIAIALAKDAKVLLLDEPTSGLDPKASNEFGQLLQKLREKGVATLMATHDLFRAKEVATTIGVMKDGQLKQQWSVEDLSLKELEDSYLETMSYNSLQS
ncbi:MAG: ABC transporter ATP-binding protein [Bacteroidota bacterium]